MSDIAALKERLLADIGAANDVAALEAVRVSALGKKGQISELMRGLGGMSPDERKTAGAALNQLKDKVAEAIAARKQVLEQAALDARLAGETQDVTLPPLMAEAGCIHPISQVIDEVTEIFAAMGFGVAEGPTIEEDFYNFTALNIPPEHPARQMHDTFYLNETDAEGGRKLLRTHTSPVQIRAMLDQGAPIRIIAPGRTYRCDSDQTHTPMFHQVEGLVVDKHIHMGHLKGCIESFCQAFFEVDSVRMRFRPSYFPFTEPSAEVDIQCDRSGNEIKFGEGNDWLEIMGCGMVNPHVLRNVNIDPDDWQGFAFGVGIDRIAMLKYGMPDLRAFFEADLRWLRHYGFSPLDMPTLGQGLSR